MINNYKIWSENIQNKLHYFNMQNNFTDSNQDMQKHFDDCLSLSARYSFGACDDNDEMLIKYKPSIAIDIESLENDFELPTNKRSSFIGRGTGRATA